MHVLAAARTRAPALTPLEARGRRARLAVAVTFFCHGVFFASWTAHIPHVKAALGLSDSGLGAVLLAAPLGVILAMALAARILPRVGSPGIVRIGVAGYCAGGLLVAAATSPALLFAALFVWGAFQALLDCAMNTQAIAVEARLGRRLMSGLHGGWSVGALLGAALGAAAVAGGLSLGHQLIIMALPIAAVVGGLSRWLLSDDAPSEPEAPDRPGRGALRPLAILAAIAFAGLLCEGAAADWGAVYLRGDLGSSAGVAGLAYTVFSLAMVATRLGGDRLLTRWSATRVLPALAAAATLAFAAALIVHSVPVTLGGFFGLGVGEALVVPSMFAAAGRIPGVDTGAGVAGVAALSYTGLLLGPALIGGLAGLVSLRAALVVLPVLTAAVAALAAGTEALRAAGPRLRPLG